ncbi:hypothetical protein O9929_03625 [Vibrio lentus]|nr:hypothetical protein [Vibrio lentus]
MSSSTDKANLIVISSWRFDTSSALRPNRQVSNESRINDFLFRRSHHRCYGALCVLIDGYVFYLVALCFPKLKLESFCIPNTRALLTSWREVQSLNSLSCNSLWSLGNSTTSLEGSPQSQQGVAGLNGMSIF